MPESNAVGDKRLSGEVLSFGTWLVLVVGSYLYVSGVLIGRGDPFLSGNGGWDLLLVVVFYPLFFVLGPRHNWLPTVMSPRTVLEWNGLYYLVPFFLALHWDSVGRALGVSFSLRGDDLGSLDARGTIILIIALAVLAGLLTYHVVWARRSGILRPYLAALIGIPCVVAIIIVSLGDQFYVHVHHFILGAFLFPFFRFRTVPSLVAQAVFLGLAVEGISRWGIDPLWYSIG